MVKDLNWWPTLDRKEQYVSLDDHKIRCLTQGMGSKTSAQEGAGQ